MLAEGLNFEGHRQVVDKLLKTTPTAVLGRVNANKLLNLGELVVEGIDCLCVGKNHLFKGSHHSHLEFAVQLVHFVAHVADLLASKFAVLLADAASGPKLLTHAVVALHHRLHISLHPFAQLPWLTLKKRGTQTLQTRLGVVWIDNLQKRLKMLRTILKQGTVRVLLLPVI